MCSEHVSAQKTSIVVLHSWFPSRSLLQAPCLWPTKTKGAQLESESRSSLSPMPTGSFENHCVRGLGLFWVSIRCWGLG